MSDIVLQNNKILLNTNINYQLQTTIMGMKNHSFMNTPTSMYPTMAVIDCIDCIVVLRPR